MSEPSWGLWGTWEETETFLGKQVGQSIGPDPVEQGSIRRWLEPKEFACAIHTDAEAARAAGYPATAAAGHSLVADRRRSSSRDRPTEPRSPKSTSSMQPATGCS